jgi:Beta-propeller repeat
MRPLRLVSLCTSLVSTMVLAQSASVISQSLVTKSAVPSVLSQPDPAMQAKVADSYGKLPLSFEANHGQADGRVKFLSRTGGYTLFLTGDEAVLALSAGKAKNKFPVETRLAASPREAKSNSNSIPESATGTVLRMKLRNANPAVKVTGTDELAGTSNYFIGNDPAKWRTNVPTYAKVKYEGIYSGIDLVYYGNQRQLEYNFIVAPGADPRRIAFDVSGAKRIRRDAHGDLVLKVGEGEIRWHKPVVYQEKEGARQEVAAHYAITDKNRVRFELAKYDANQPLYVDPLLYSTYLDGSGEFYGGGIAVDSSGNAYVTGLAVSNFQPTPGAFRTTFGGGSWDAFVTKFNPAGSALVYSTYLGGSGADYGTGIAADSAGNAYVTGNTCSTDFPTKNPLQQTYGGGSSTYMCGDAFVTKISPAGSALVYSTYLGGSDVDVGLGIAVDSTGNAYVTGATFSTNFPTVNPLQPAYGGNGDAFVSKISPTGSALVYSTYLGGSSTEDSFAVPWLSYGGIAADSAGNAYVTGFTQSTDFPTMNPFQPANGGDTDAFVTKINPTGSALVYSTYLGGSSADYGHGIAVDSAGNAYVTGFAQSNNFPTMNPLQPTNHGYINAFVAEINPSGSTLVYSTYLGGEDADYGNAVAVGSAGDAYVTGYTTSTTFPVTPGAFEAVCNHGLHCSHYGDAFVTKINSAGSALAYSTYLGGNRQDYGYGIAVDSAGSAYVTGQTDSVNFPTKNPLQPNAVSGAFVTKIDTRAVTTTTLSSSRNPSIYGQAVTFTARRSLPAWARRRMEKPSRSRKAQRYWERGC